MENLGFLAALGAALAWGTYMVPFKKSNSDNLVQFQALIGVGILVSGVIISLMLGFPLSFNLYGIVAGILWAIANAIALVAIANLGLSLATPLMVSIIIISTFLWGAVVFHELPEGILTASGGILLILLGVIIVSALGSTKSANIKKGLVAGIFAGIVWGSQITPLKLGEVLPAHFFFSSCLGIFVMSVIISVFKRIKFKNEAVGLSLLSGVIWNIGNLLSIISVSLIGLAKGFPVTQSAVLIAVLWGLFYFKEIREKKLKMQVLTGAVVLLLGVITLSLA